MHLDDFRCSLQFKQDVEHLRDDKVWAQSVERLTVERKQMVAIVTEGKQ
jgi:hypothetical protein